MARVLLVDDEQNIRWTMAEFLKRQGHEPLPAKDYESAVGILDTEHIDVAVVDIILPGRSGIDLVREIGNRSEYIPILVITGEPSLSQVPEILRAGACDFLAKPVLKDALTKAVSAALGKKLIVDRKREFEERVRTHAGELEALVDERARELAEAHDFLNAVLDSSTEYAIVATDIEGEMTLFNKGAERIFGHPARNCLGFSVVLLFDGYLAPVWSEAEVVKEVHEKGVYKGQFKFRGAGGTFTGALALTPIRCNDHSLTGYLHIIKDLTEETSKQEEMRRMQQRLAAAERAAELGKVAAQIAHEVKNPLSGLKLYSLHLRSKLGERETAQIGIAEKIIATIDHLSEIVERVLNFARPLNLEYSQADLNQVAIEAAQLLENQIAASHVVWTWDMVPGQLFSRLDRAAVRSVLVNLMLNSIQAMPEGGGLTIRTRAAEHTVRIEVADTGCGMSDQQVRSVFEPFFTTKARGLGLGLYYARKVVDQHRGTINVESAEGKGTRVTISLPTKGA
ncbi:MAG TPA: ATP-binding protein [Blastocatellia bacterium]|nr:ATP-binding protein [Blastocatellia bacterium]